MKKERDDNKISRLKEHLRVVKEDYNRQVDRLNQASKECERVLSDKQKLEEERDGVIADIEQKKSLVSFLKSKENELRRREDALSRSLESLEEQREDLRQRLKAEESAVSLSIREKEDKSDHLDDRIASQGLKIARGEQKIANLDSTYISKQNELSERILGLREQERELLDSIDKRSKELYNIEQDTKSAQDALHEYKEATEMSRQELEEKEEDLTKREKDVRVIIRRIQRRFPEQTLNLRK